MSSFDSPLSNKELAVLMMKHGIACRNDEEILLLEKRIAAIGYYRLEEYSWQFRKTNSSDKSKRTAYFKQKINFSLIWETYLFDRRVRMLLVDAIERMEIAFRNAVTQVLTLESGSNTPHVDFSLLPGMAVIDKKTGKTRLQKWLSGIQAKYDDSGTSDPRMEHCKKAHGVKDVEDLPLWIVMELTTFGNLRTLYENMRDDLKCKVAAELGVDVDFLTATFPLIHQVRNHCAHHKRVWNYLWLKKSRFRGPLFVHKPSDPRWYYQYDAENSTWAPGVGQSPALSFNPRDTAFIFLLCGFWLDRVAQTSHWKDRVESLMQPHGKLLKAAREAGFCFGWEKHPLWR